VTLPLRPLFHLGRIVSTPGALRALEEAKVNPLTLLLRHNRGDWGDLDASDIEANRRAIAHNLRVLSAYQLPTGARVWVITEADRSSTTLLLPTEY